MRNEDDQLTCRDVFESPATSRVVNRPAPSRSLDLGSALKFAIDDDDEIPQPRRRSREENVKPPVLQPNYQYQQGFQYPQRAQPFSHGQYPPQVVYQQHYQQHSGFYGHPRPYSHQMAYHQNTPYGGYYPPYGPPSTYSPITATQSQDVFSPIRRMPPVVVPKAQSHSYQLTKPLADCNAREVMMAVSSRERPQPKSNIKYTLINGKKYEKPEIMDDEKEQEVVKPDRKQSRMDSFLVKSRRVDKGSRQFGLVVVQEAKKKAVTTTSKFDDSVILVEDSQVVVADSQEEVVPETMAVFAESHTFENTDPSPNSQIGNDMKENEEPENLDDTRELEDVNQHTRSEVDETIPLASETVEDLDVTKELEEDLDETVEPTNLNENAEFLTTVPETLPATEIFKTPTTSRTRGMESTLCETIVVTSVAVSEESLDETLPLPSPIVKRGPVKRKNNEELHNREKMMKELLDDSFMDKRENGYEIVKENARGLLSDDQVVRKADDRNRMHGQACPCCQDYYEKLDMSPESKRKYIDKVSRHRYVNKPMTSTPEHYWEVDMPSESEMRRRGMINVVTKPTRIRQEDRKEVRNWNFDAQ